jgi:hypothetical protein
MVTGELEKATETIARPGTGTIAGIIGPEGAGKDCLMTRFATVFWEMGYDVYAFPGYHLLNPIRHSKDPNKKFKVISEEIMPEDWVNLPMNLHDILIVISEADSHFNSLESQYEIAKNMVSLMKQRRKRSLTILYNVQNWGWFNNRMRWLTHILFQCTDIYWHTRNGENPIPRGQQIGVTPFDCKGFYTGREWTQGTPFTFDATKIWENFDTYETTNQEQSVGSVRVKRSRRNLEVIDGQIMNAGADKASGVNMKAIEKLADQYAHNYGQRDLMIKQAINTFLDKGDTIPRNLLTNVISQMNLHISTPELGKIIHGMNGRLISGRGGKESVYYFNNNQQQEG